MKTLLQTLAVVTILILAGCNTSPTTQTTPEPTTSNVATTSYTATTTTTQTATTTTEPFKASVSFPSCTQATINAESYSWVGFILENGSTTREGNYTDTNEFETDSVIQSVIIVSETGEVEVSNPGYEQCTAPPTTTTEETTVETTVRTTTAPTTTPPTTATTQTPTTTTTTTQTTTRPPLEESKISTHIENETLGRNATAVHVVTNYHDTTVRFHYDVGFYDHRNGGSDFMESVDRTTLVLEPGESARVVAEYDGNVTIDDIRYQINGLRYAE